MIRDGSFQEDLYYRLNAVRIDIPALKDRIEDLPLFIRHLLPAVNSRLSTRVDGISEDALRVFAAYDWPGNIRELQNILQRAAILSEGATIREPEARTALAESFSGNASGLMDHDQAKIMKGECVCLKEVMHRVEEKIIREALRRAGGIQSEAAKCLGLNPKNLWKKINKHGIKVSRSQG